MKKIIKSAVSVTLVIVCILSLFSCGNSADKTDLWKSAVYQNDTELGEGQKTVVVEVTAEDKAVTFTINTDQNTVGAALSEHNLIDGDESEYGLYIKVVNGITADYDVDKSYWAFYIDGEYALTGIDSAEIKEGVTYQLAYTK